MTTLLPKGVYRQILREAARRLAARDIDVFLFTSPIQLDHLFRIAGELGIEAEVRSSLARHAALASFGPIMTASLEAVGLQVDIIPIHPKMGGLVKASAEHAAGVLARKRAK